jgi:PAS domain S-box-containing protein
LMCATSGDEERARLQRELVASETRYRRLFETAKDGILILDASTGHITDANPFLAHLLGYSREELLGKRLWEIGPFKNTTKSKVAFEELQNNDYIRYEDLPLETRDGTSVDVEFVSNVYAVNGDKVIQCNIRDITARKQVEKRLRLKTTALESAANAIVLTNASGNITWVNAAFTTMTGYTADEALGQNPRILKSGTHPQSFYKAMWGTLQKGHIWRGEVVNRRKDGALYTEEMTITPVRDDRGDITHFIAIKQDVTQRRLVEEALRSLVDNAPFGICRTSIKKDCYETVNATFREMLGGYSVEEALELKISKQVWADHKCRDRMIEILRQNYRIKGFEGTFKRRDGSPMPVRISGALIRDVDGTEHFEGYVEDMTQQSTLEQQVRQVQKLEAVGRLAGGMAHDFNNVLVVIKLSTELMLGQITPDNPLSKPLLQVSNAADRAAALTRQMLAFGRQQMMQTRIINLNSVVGETSHMLRRVIGEDIQLVTNLSNTVDNARLDPDQVAQVMLNLAVNARDAMPDGGMLHIETSNVDLDDAYTKAHPPVQPGRYVMLAVGDTGTGIDKSILPRIFDPFFTTKDLGKGTGLGLSIVYGIVKQSGGYIWVYSEPGHGTTFKLYFPATTAAQEVPVTRSEIVPRPAGQKVLVVEDEAMIRSNVSECLQQLGYEVLEAENGEAALHLCSKHQSEIDLVLTDLVMPGISGHQLAGELAQRHPEIKMLFMSGYTEDSAARRDILLKGSPFLQKPFSVGDLSNAVQQALTLQAVSRNSLAAKSGR